MASLALLLNHPELWWAMIDSICMRHHEQPEESILLHQCMVSTKPGGIKLSRQ